jgi:hypothetical protein
MGGRAAEAALYRVCKFVGSALGEKAEFGFVFVVSSRFLPVVGMTELGWGRGGLVGRIWKPLGGSFHIVKDSNHYLGG